MPSILKNYGCSAVEKACGVFKLLGSKATSTCKTTFGKHCPTLMGWIKKNQFDSEQACALI